MSALVEQIAELHRLGHEVIIVSSGSCALGRRKLAQHELLSRPLSSYVQGGSIDQPSVHSLRSKQRCAAACGQSQLLSFYEFLFSLKGLSTAQVLLTEDDFESASKRENLRDTLDTLLQLGMIPIINENDVISSRGMYRDEPLTSNGDQTATRKSSRPSFKDNDGLACLVSIEIDVDLMILLSDVEGLFARPPNEVPSGEDNKIIHTYVPENSVVIGTKSKVGRGGMASKIFAAKLAVEKGVGASIIASGFRSNVLLDIVAGQTIGTLFCLNPMVEDTEPNLVDIAINARIASRNLQQLSREERERLMVAIADRLIKEKEIIFNNNERDMIAAHTSHTAASLVSRLKLTEKKLQALEEGIKQISKMEEPIGRVVQRTKVADDLLLEQETVPIGVLLVIFESRPDVLPQVASLAIRSGNGLILKGGKEALYSNRVLHDIITNTIDEFTGGRVKGRDLVNLVESRDAVDQLLKLHEEIDLVIPRGSKQLVTHVQNNTKIPVLGHAEGVCHVYVDSQADMTKAKALLVDAKTDYPSACNAVETILLHEDLVKDSRVTEILRTLREHKVRLFGGKRAQSQLLLEPVSTSTGFKSEYGDLAVTVEIVSNLQEAIDHINTYGSGHTDLIVTEDNDAAKVFQKRVDSACVFHNTSTRFADGYRMGLGCEVGISTNRIHARGPVGIEGLMTTRWKMTSKDYDTATQFHTGEKHFTHESLPAAGNA